MLFLMFIGGLIGYAFGRFPGFLIGAALTMGGVAVVALAERGLRAGAAKA